MTNKNVMPVILVNIDCVTGNCDKMFSPLKSQLRKNIGFEIHWKTARMVKTNYRLFLFITIVCIWLIIRMLGIPKIIVDDGAISLW